MAQRKNILNGLLLHLILCPIVIQSLNSQIWPLSTQPTLDPQDNDYSYIAFYPPPSALVWIAYTITNRAVSSTIVSLIKLDPSQTSAPTVLFTGNSEQYTRKCDDIRLVPLGNIDQGDVPRVLIFCNGNYMFGQTWIQSLAACNTSNPECHKLNWVILNTDFPFPITDFMFCQTRVCPLISALYPSGNSQSILFSAVAIDSNLTTIATTIFSLDVATGSLEVVQKIAPFTDCSPPNECPSNGNGVYFDNLLQFAVVVQHVIYPNSSSLAFVKLDLKTGIFSPVLIVTAPDTNEWHFALTSSTSGSSLGILQLYGVATTTMGLDLADWQILSSSLFPFPNYLFADVSHLDAFSFNDSAPQISKGPLLYQDDSPFSTCESLYQPPATANSPWTISVNCLETYPFQTNFSVFHTNINRLWYTRLLSNVSCPEYPYYCILIEVESNWT